MPDAFEVFQTGAAQADAAYGAETRDVDRLLHGLAAVLDASGTPPGAVFPNWRLELDSRFGRALAHLSVPADLRALQGVVDELDTELLRRAGTQPHWSVSQVLELRLPPVFTECRFGGAVNRPQELSDCLYHMRAHVAPGGLLRHDLEIARRAAHNLRRCADIVDILSANIAHAYQRAGVQAVRACVQEFETAADTLESQAKQQIEAAEARLARVPVDAANCLAPLSSLPAHLGHKCANVAQTGRFASDRTWIADLEAAPSARDSAALARTVAAPVLDQVSLASCWDLYLKKREPADVAGVEETSGRAIVVVGDRVVGVCGHRLRWLCQHMHPDAFEVGAGCIMLTLLREGKPVAGLSIQHHYASTQIDPAAARARAAAIRSFEGADGRANKVTRTGKETQSCL